MMYRLRSYSGSPLFGLLVLLVFDNSLGPRSPGLCLLKLPAWSVCQLWSTTTQQARTRQKLSFQSYASSTLSTLEYNNNRREQDAISCLQCNVHALHSLQQQTKTRQKLSFQSSQAPSIRKIVQRNERFFIKAFNLNICFRAIWSISPNSRGFPQTLDPKVLLLIFIS